MAKAEITTVVERYFTLTLTPEEARVLRTLTGSITGGGDARLATDAIYDALGEAGSGNYPGLQFGYRRPDGTYIKSPQIYMHGKAT